MLHPVGLAVAALMGLLQVGCSPCRTGAVHCEGDTLVACVGSSDGHSSWSRLKCDGVCLSVDGSSFCALGDAPEPGCAGGDARQCIGNAVTTCHKGYSTHAEACGSGTCIPAQNASDEPLCALSAQPDPACNGNHASSCDGNRWLTCQRGYRTADVACPAGQTCQIGEVHLEQGTFAVGVCALDPTPDPRCRTDLASGQDAHCDGQVMTGCYGGYVVLVEQCAPDVECFRHDAGWGECLGASVSRVGDPYGVPPHMP